MITDAELYDALIQLHGSPGRPTHPTEGQLSRWQGTLPEPLLRYWTEQGWGWLSDGQYWVCNPDLLRPVIEEVFTGDPEYTPDDLIPFGYNALGMIDLFMGQGKTMTLDLPFGTVTWRDQSINKRGKPNSDFRALYNQLSGGAEGLDWTDEDGVAIFPWALENLGPLDPGEIYGFVPAYAMSERYPVANLQRVPLIEHLVLLASLQPPTIYDYERPEGGQGGFGTLVPKRVAGPQG